MSQDSREENCSVLMCVYKKDKPEFLREAVESVTIKQSFKPNDFVLIVDGPIGKRLQDVIDELKAEIKYFNPVFLPENKGVGPASNEGIKHCKNELIAKMDADDIAHPDRLKLQVETFQKNPKLAILGGQLAEFSDSVDNIKSYRRVPREHKEIVKFLRKRSPFNNQTVMYRKSAVLEAGGYPNFNRAEDYYLFAKILKNGGIAENLPDTLAYFRVDQDAYERRKTWRHTKENIKVRNEIRKLGMTSFTNVASFAIIQTLMFIMPTGFTKFIYKILRHE